MDCYSCRVREKEIEDLIKENIRLRSALYELEIELECIQEDCELCPELREEIETERLNQD